LCVAVASGGFGKGHVGDGDSSAILDDDFDSSSPQSSMRSRHERREERLKARRSQSSTKVKLGFESRDSSTKYV
jgi:hypothetical protein